MFIPNLNILWHLKSKIINYFDSTVIRIRIRPDSDPDPQHWYLHQYFFNFKKIYLETHFLQWLPNIMCISVLCTIAQAHIAL